MVFLLKTLSIVVLCFCFFDDVTADSECSPLWTKYEGNCYRFFGEPKTWKDAQNYCCDTFEANLVSIHDADENDVVHQLWRTSLVPGSSYSDSCWIGLYHDQGEFWCWQDNHATAQYTTWVTGEPNGSGECGHFWKNSASSTGNKWDDMGCNALSPFVCKTSACSHKKSCNRA